jgi:hypothetical protein
LSATRQLGTVGQNDIKIMPKSIRVNFADRDMTLRRVCMTIY